MFERKNLIIQAPVFSLSGYGGHSRDFVMGLFNSGQYNISLAVTSWGHSSQWQPAKDVDDALIFMTNNRFATNSEFTWIQFGVPSEFKRVAPINIAVTAGLEVDNYPQEWCAQCNQMSALIVPSNFVKDRFLKLPGITVPIYVVPEGVDTSVFNNKPNKPTAINEIKFPTEFNFLVSGQWLPGGIGEDRKNIPLSIFAIIEALVDNPDVGVVVKTAIHNQSSPDKYMLISRMSEILGPKTKGRVHFVHGKLTDAELVSLYQHPQIKAFVSLTHGEGYFRPLAEAIACDLPIIVTGYSGHMDYVNPDKATLVDYEMGDVPQSSWMPGLLGQGQKWAVPNYNHAKNRIIRCYNSYDVAKNRAVDLGNDIRTNWSLEASTKILLDTMSQIFNQTGDFHQANLGRIEV